MNHSGKKKKKYCPEISRKRDPAKLYTCDRERVSEATDNQDGPTHKNYNCPGNSSAALESKNQSRTIAGGSLEIRTRGNRSRQLSHLGTNIHAKSLKAREKQLGRSPHHMIYYSRGYRWKGRWLWVVDGEMTVRGVSYRRLRGKSDCRRARQRTGGTRGCLMARRRAKGPTSGEGNRRKEGLRIVNVVARFLEARRDVTGRGHPGRLPQRRQVLTSFRGRYYSHSSRFRKAEATPFLSGE